MPSSWKGQTPLQRPGRICLIPLSQRNLVGSIKYCRISKPLVKVANLFCQTTFVTAVIAAMEPDLQIEKPAPNRYKHIFYLTSDD